LILVQKIINKYFQNLQNKNIYIVDLMRTQSRTDPQGAADLIYTMHGIIILVIELLIVLTIIMIIIIMAIS